MRRRAAFSLVELLVVIGLIALLISLLLPALNRAREQARQMQCLSNMRQIGLGFMMYLTENRNHFPRPSAQPFQPEDWVYWDAQRNPDYNHTIKGVVAPYIAKRVSASVYRCPSDDINAHQAVEGQRYPYSYSVNERICAYVGIIVNGKPRNSLSTSQIRHSSNKVLLIDESEDTIDDGCWAWQWEFGGGENVMANRHDRRRETVTNPNAGRGNAIFADGHGDFIERRSSFDPQYYDAELN